MLKLAYMFSRAAASLTQSGVSPREAPFRSIGLGEVGLRPYPTYIRAHLHSKTHRPPAVGLQPNRFIRKAAVARATRCRGHLSAKGDVCFFHRNRAGYGLTTGMTRQRHRSRASTTVPCPSTAPPAAFSLGPLFRRDSWWTSEFPGQVAGRRRGTRDRNAVSLWRSSEASAKVVTTEKVSCGRCARVRATAGI